MRERWVALVVLGVLLVAPVLAHKAPILTFGKIGPYEFTYAHNPLQGVVFEPVVFLAQVAHPSGRPIVGDITMEFTIYDKVEVTEWDGAGKPEWIIISKAEGESYGANRFRTTTTFERPGHYQVVIQVYENGLFLGRSVQMMDIEARTIGPMFVIFNLVILFAVMFGVWRGIL